MPDCGKSSTFAAEIMKRIAYISPVDYVRGSLSGHQDVLNYTEDRVAAYDVTNGDTATANNYSPSMVAKVLRPYAADRIMFFQIRTKSSVHMTATSKRNMALMGGVGALVASLLRQKSSPIYIACAAAVPKKWTLRQFISPILREGLAAKSETITIADGVQIVNPWISASTPNVPVPANIIAKFASELSNS